MNVADSRFKAIAVTAETERPPVKVHQQASIEELIEALRIVEEVHLASQVTLESGESEEQPSDTLECVPVQDGEIGNAKS